MIQPKTPVPVIFKLQPSFKQQMPKRSHFERIRHLHLDTLFNVLKLTSCRIFSPLFWLHSSSHVTPLVETDIEHKIKWSNLERLFIWFKITEKNHIQQESITINFLKMVAKQHIWLNTSWLGTVHWIQNQTFTFQFKFNKEYLEKTQLYWYLIKENVMYSCQNLYLSKKCTINCCVHSITGRHSNILKL